MKTIYLALGSNLGDRAGNIARAIEALYAERLEDHYGELAHHYGRGADSRKAARYLSLAAAQELERAVQCEPDLDQAYYQLGRVYAALGEAEKSKQAYRTFESVKEKRRSEDQRLEMEVMRELENP